MKHVFLTGGSSGIGKSCVELLRSHGHAVTAPGRSELDMLNNTQIENVALANYDVVINCAAVNTGTYLGFHNNTNRNQLNQIQVNFVAPLLLAKNYSQARSSGHFVYISSATINNPRLYNLVNCTAKAALRYAMNVLREELDNFVVTEICPGKTKTNMLKQNYHGAKTDQEVEAEYETQPYLNPDQVAQSVLFAIDNQIDLIQLTP